MLLKLLMPYVDRLTAGGVIVKWHRREGERVGYGDDLFDMRVEARVKKSEKSLGEKIQLLKGARPLHEEDLEMVEEETPSLIYMVRVTSSDRGTLRRVAAAEGAYGAVGRLLAVFSTEDHDSLDRLEEQLSQASEFRVVTNMVP